MSSIEAILTASQLRWTGHVTRMSSDRLPKAVFYGELSSGKRLRGGQRLRYKDVLKRHIKTTHIPVNTWEPIAHDRQKWRRAMHQGKTLIEEKCKAQGYPPSLMSSSKTMDSKEEEKEYLGCSIHVQLINYERKTEMFYYRILT